jgi:hypothetical protein
MLDTNDHERIAYMNQSGCWTYLCDLQDTQEIVKGFDGEYENALEIGKTEASDPELMEERDNALADRDSAIAEHDKLAALLRSVHALLCNDDTLRLKPARQKLAKAMRTQASYAGVSL